MTICLALRVAHNDNMWLKPSKGRLYQSDDYVGENGFAHEDWNFNLDLFEGDYIFGFQQFKPKKEKFNSKYNLCFYDYDKYKKMYFVVGFYLDADYIEEGMPLNDKIMQRKKEDLIELRDSLSENYFRNIDKRLKNEFSDCRWKVLKKNVVILDIPIPYPQTVRRLNYFHYTGCVELSTDEFNQIFDYVQTANDGEKFVNYDGFPEGKEKLAVHKSRERNNKLIEQKKVEFKRSHDGQIFCEACGMNFFDVYGEYGKDFIEVHHIVPISESIENRKTQMQDLVLLCSNCHRMIHHRRPWLSKEQLKELLKNPRPH